EEATRRLAEQLAEATGRLAEAEGRLETALGERRLVEERLAAAVDRRLELETRLAEAEALAARHGERVAELTSGLRTLERTAEQRDAAISELEGELIEREA